MGNKREPFESESFYHIYNHGNGDDTIFRSHENYLYFLRKYAEYIDPIAEIYAYCLMPNHFHFAVRIRDEKVLAEVFCKKKDPRGFENLAGLNLPDLISKRHGDFLNGYAKAFNKMYNRKGSLFLENLQRKKVENESYLTRLICYIHYNPVHHGFVKSLSEWPYSSYLAFLKEKKTKLKRKEVLDWFGGRKEFENYHNDNPSEKLILEDL